MPSKTIPADAVVLPDAPTIPGLTFRRFRGPSDYPNMVAVIDGSKVADKIERAETADDLARSYDHLTNCDPYQDMLFVEVDGRVIGYSRVTWWQEENGPRVYLSFGFLLPEWRRRGIGRAMLRANDETAALRAARHGAIGGAVLVAFPAAAQLASPKASAAGALLAAGIAAGGAVGLLALRGAPASRTPRPG